MGRAGGAAAALAAALLLAAVSCRSTRERRELFVAENPQLPVPVKNAIRRGEVVGGMRPADVRAAWGEPADIVEEVRRDGRRVLTWVYFRTFDEYTNVYHVAFIDGRVAEVRFVEARPAPSGEDDACVDGTYGGARMEADVYNVRRYLRQREALRLTPEQVARLEEIRTRYRARYEQARNMIELDRTSVDNLRGSSNPDFDLIRQKMRDISRLQSDLREEWVSAGQEGYFVLTPAQRSALPGGR